MKKDKKMKKEKLIKSLNLILDDLKIVRKSYADSIENKDREIIKLNEVKHNHYKNLVDVDNKINAYKLLINDLSLKKSDLNISEITGTDITNTVAVSTVTDINHPNNQNITYTSEADFNGKLT